MNLRRQLLLVSLLTLILPWAGCQFISETESALREGQQHMLGGTAKAIADSLSQFSLELLATTSARAGGRIYAHPLESAPFVDGYMDDWTVPDGAMVNLRGKDGPVRYVVGAYSQYLYFFVSVRDNTVVYRHTGEGGIGSHADAVTLISVDGSSRTEYRLSAEAPGEIVATRVTANREIDETRISADWQDTGDGYQLEIRAPRNLFPAAVGLTVSNTDSAGTAGVASESFDRDGPGPLVSISPVLQSVASGYVQPGLRLVVTDRDGWRVAAAGNLSLPDENSGDAAVGAGWLRLIYNLILEPGDEAKLAEPAPNGREQLGYIAEALSGGVPEPRWFRNEATGTAVVSVARPVWSGNVQTGAIILQQGTDAILSLTNRALTRLIILTLVTTIIVAAVLIGYASWLSLRIQRLSNAAELALDEKRLSSSLPSALASDEVGDLSRSFSSVLRQLGVYNDYLQSLASKLSHELRTPLTIVRSSLENLEHEALSAAGQKYAERARDGTDRLQNILNAMSEANRTEELVKNAETERFDLCSVLRATVAAYADAWPEREFAFSSAVSDAVIHGSPELIIQMLDKLIANAMDFTETGERISISLQREKDSIVIAVANPGQPLPEAMGDGLFRSMVSVRKGDAGKHLGLGLYIAKLIAEGHGGKIAAANTGDGVVFTVTLAMAKTSPAGRAPTFQ